ncbi:MAG TPA: hypothetical protein VIK27_11370 [Candidatus Aquilonibacter sp.]
MKRSFLLAAMMLAGAFGATCSSAAAATTLGVGQVCGWVDAPSTTIIALELAPIAGNIVVARSATEDASTTVQADGHFCFAHLHADLHTLSAFGESPAAYGALVTPVAGASRYVELVRTTE